MNTPTKLILLLLLIASAVFLSNNYLAGTMLTGTPVNMNFGDVPQTNPAGIIGKYYVGTGLIDGDSMNYVFVPEGMLYKDKIALEFKSKDSVFKAPVMMPIVPINYFEIDYVLGFPHAVRKEVPYKTVDMRNQRITLSANVNLVEPDGTIQRKSIGNTNNYKQEFIVQDNDGIDRTIHVRYNELSFKSGDLPPSGDLDVLEILSGNHILVTHDNLKERTGSTSILECSDYTSTWNCYFTEHRLKFKNSDIDEYEDYLNWMLSDDKLPNAGPSASESYNVVGNELLISYPSTVFTQSVTFYIPEELAEFIMVVEQIPEFKFDSISTIKAGEGNTEIVEVKGTAINSGTINLHIEGPGVESAIWLGGSEKQIVKGNDYIFTVYVKVAQVDSDKKLHVDVFSQPSGMGVPTETRFYIEIEDTTGAKTYDLRVTCIDSNDEIVSSAEIYIDNVFSGYGDITKSVVKGSHVVYSKNVTGWYSGYPENNPKSVSVYENKAVEIPYTTHEPGTDDDYTLFIIGGIAIIGIILLSLIARELGLDVTVTHIVALIGLVVFLIVGYLTLDVVRELIDAIKDFNLLGD